MLTQYTRSAVLQRLQDKEIRQKLQAMEVDISMHTGSSFTANSTDYPDNQIPFVDKHIAYLLDHPKVDPDQYLSNLRLMLKVRG